MNVLEYLAQFPGHGEFSRRSLILLFAYYLRKYEGSPEFAPKDVARCFHDAMLRVPTDLAVLLKPLATGRNSSLIRGSGGSSYALSLAGLHEVEAILPTAPAVPAVTHTPAFLDTALPYLKKTIARVKDDLRREFLAEAVSCLGVEARRATIVMTWLAAIDHMYEYVATHKLADFNGALHKRSGRESKLTMSSRDDFGDLKESIFIEVCRSANIITNDVRKILDEKLGIRNSSAHPASVQIRDSKVVDFVEDLIDNVIVKYPL